MTDAKKNQAADESAKKGLQKTAADKSTAQKNNAEKDKVTPGKTATGLLSVVLLLLVIAAGGLAAYNFQQIKAFKSATNTDQEGVQEKIQATLGELDRQIQDANQVNSAIATRLDELEAKQHLLKDSMSKANSQTVELNSEFALAEIEHLLTIANYRLQLNHDVPTALTAMETADLRLQRLDVSGVLQVREQLIADMNSLRSLNQSDLSGLGLFLSDLINRIDSLPVKEDVIVSAPGFEEVTPAADEENSVKTFFKLVWAELKSLVIISRDSNVNKTMLLPDEVYFLRSNIKLELANARFAVFNRDTENFTASIAHIQGWLDNYFDKSDAAVRNVYESLQRMNKLQLAFPRIDISSSIESVRALSHRVAEQDGLQQDPGNMTGGVEAE